MKQIVLSDSLSLPLNAVTQKFAFLARTGAGKTYAASKLAEGMLDVGAQVVALDPVGVWWGLRLAADGKGKGISIPVLGGLHGDIPLNAESGALIADLVVDKNISAVIDVSMFRKGERKHFAMSFAEQLFHRKKAHRSPMHLFVEEAQAFVPQRVMKGEERMLGAFEDIIKLGRNYGIGASLISQRPQAVNKDVLNQTEALFVLQTNGAQERKALSEWIVEKGLNAKDLVDQLPSLPVGTAYLWSPSWLQKLEKVRIGKRHTFNASSTPEVGVKHIEPRELDPMELKEVESALASVIQEAAAKDPAKLRARILELEKQLKKQESKTTEKRVEVPVVDDAQLKRIEVVSEKVSRGQVVLSEWYEGLTAEVKKITEAVRQLKAPAVPTAPPRLLPWKAPVKQLSPAEFSRSDTKLPRGARDMLAVLAASLLPSLSRSQVAMLAGLKKTSGTFAKYLSIIKTSGYVEEHGDEMVITEAGIVAIGGRPPAPQSTEQLQAMWEAKLPLGAKKMLQLLVKTHPDAMTRDELAAGVDPPLTPSSGTFAKYLSILRSNGLVDTQGAAVIASNSLFLSDAA